MKFEDYLSLVNGRFVDKKYRIYQNPEIKGYKYDLIAQKTGFSPSYFGFFTDVFLFSYFDSPDIDTLVNFSTNAYKATKKIIGIKPPRGLAYGFNCFPVAITNKLDESMVEVVSNLLYPKHWAAFEKVAVFSLDDCKLYYSCHSPSWGALYHDFHRALQESILGVGNSD